MSAEITPRKVRLRLRKDYEIRVGDKISALVELIPPSHPVQPNGFDFRRFMYFKGIGAVGFIYKDVEILETGNDTSFNSKIEKLRFAIGQYVHDILPNRLAGVITALIVGQRGGIDEKDQETLRAAGLAHLLAISGLHVGLICGSVFFFSRGLMALFPYLALRHPIKKYASAMAIFAGIFYMLLAGATVPTQRAMFMSGVIFFAIILDRSPFSLRLVSLAALMVLAFAPESLLSPSFQMSFAAVTGLIAFYEWAMPHIIEFNRQANWIKKLSAYFIGLCVTTLIASIVTAPFALYHFQHISALGSVANLIAVPLMAFLIMPMAVVAFVTMMFGLAEVPFILMGYGVQVIFETAVWAQNLDGAVLRLPAISLTIFLLYVFGLLFCVMMKGRLKLLGVVLLVLGVSFSIAPKEPDILISEDHKLVAYKNTNGNIFFNTARRNSFVAENWLQSWGKDKGDYQILGRNQHNNGKCDDLGCHFKIRRYKVALSYNSYSHVRDCSWANIIISQEPVRIPCSSSIVIDRWDTWHNGAHALYLGDDITQVDAGAGDKGRAWH